MPQDGRIQRPGCGSDEDMRGQRIMFLTHFLVAAFTSRMASLKEVLAVPGLTRKAVGPQELIRTGEIEPAVGHYRNGVCAGAAASGNDD